MGKIPLDIKNGKTTPLCENVVVFTTKVTWIVKYYVETRHKSWKNVDVKEKDELIDCIRVWVKK